MMTPLSKQEYTEKLATLGQWVIDQSREYDIDGGDVQDKMEELGLLVRITVNEPCGETCRCLEYYDEFPAECLRLVEVG